jgi:hypothetical protein
MTCLYEIAEGAAFDVAEAVRAIAKHLTLHETLQAAGAAQASDELKKLLDARLAEMLRSVGLDTPEKVQRAPDAVLLSLDGIGEKTVARIRARLGAIEQGRCDHAVPQHQLRFEQLQDEEEA